MSRDDEHLLRWYPAGWRARYGDEMAALLHDTYGAAGSIPLRARLGLMWAGLEERAREAGLVGPAGGPGGRVRGGSLLVLCAFALFVAGGAMFAKFTDQWSGATPRNDLTLPTAGFDIVVVAAVVAGALVLLAAEFVVPASSGWCAPGVGAKSADRSCVRCWRGLWRPRSSGARSAGRAT